MMNYGILIVLFLSISCSTLIMPMEDLLNVFIKAHNGKQYEIKVNKTDDKLKVKDLKEIIVKNENEKDDYEELKNVVLSAFINNSEKLLEDEEYTKDIDLIKNTVMKIVLLEDIQKKVVLSDTSPLQEQNDTTYIFKNSFLGLSETGGGKAIKVFAGLLEGSAIKKVEGEELLNDELVKKQIHHKENTYLDDKNNNIWDNLNLKEYSENSSLLAKIINDLLIIAEYMGRLDQFVLGLPDLLEQYPEVLKAEEFFITDPNLKKRIENILCSAYIKEIAEQFEQVATLTREIDDKLILSGVSLHPVKELLAVGGKKDVRIFDLHDPINPVLKETLFSSDQKNINSVAFNSTGDMVAAGLDGGYTKIWNLISDRKDLFKVFKSRSYKNNTNHLVRVEINYKDYYDVNLVRWHPIYGNIFVVGANEKVKILDTRKEEYKIRLQAQGRGKSVESLEWNPDGNLLAVASLGFKIWDVSNLDSPKEKRKLPYDEKVSALAWHPKKYGLVAIVRNHGVIQIFDVRSNSGEPKLKGLYKGYLNSLTPKNDICSLSWHSTGKLLIIGSVDSSVKILDTSDFDNITLKATLSGHQGSVKSVVWHPYEPIIISVDDDGCVIIWKPKISFEELINKILNLEKSERLKINKKYLEKKKEDAIRLQRQEYQRQEEQKKSNEEKELEEEKKQKEEERIKKIVENSSKEIKERPNVLEYEQYLKLKEEEEDRLKKEEIEIIQQKKKLEEEKKLQEQNKKLEEDQLLKEIQSNQIIVSNTEGNQPFTGASLDLIEKIKIDDKQKEDDSLKQEKEPTTSENNEKLQENQNQYQDQQKEKKDDSQSTPSFVLNLVNATKKFFINPIFSVWTWVKSWFW